MVTLLRTVRTSNTRIFWSRLCRGVFSSRHQPLSASCLGSSTSLLGFAGRTRGLCDGASSDTTPRQLAGPLSRVEPRSRRHSSPRIIQSSQVSTHIHQRKRSDARLPITHDSVSVAIDDETKPPSPKDTRNTPLRRFARTTDRILMRKSTRLTRCSKDSRPFSCRG